MSTDFSQEPLVPSDWISQAEAARLRGVTRQAIAKLVRNGRLKSINIAGHVLINRADLLAFEPRAAGRPKSDSEK